MTILESVNLTKSYDGVNKVLDNFNIKFESGRIIGLLGPNGCGKSTFIKLVSGLLVPDSGQILIDGKPAGELTNSLISYLPERTYFSNWMKVEELLDYFADFYSDFDKDRAEKMLSDLGISKDKQLKTLSKGTKEKVQLILVMARKAKLYLLDEPIAGVDPASREYILRTIIGNYSEDATIVITTHLIHDIEPIINDFVFLGYGGQIKCGGSADDARNQTGKSLNELFKEVFKCENY